MTREATAENARASFANETLTYGGITARMTTEQGLRPFVVTLTRDGVTLDRVVVTAAPVSASDTARAFLSMFHLAWMTAAVTVLGVFPPSYKVYLSCSMANLVLGWWVSPAPLADRLAVSAAMPPLWLVLTKFADRVGGNYGF